MWNLKQTNKQNPTKLIDRGNTLMVASLGGGVGGMGKGSQIVKKKSICSPHFAPNTFLLSHLLPPPTTTLAGYNLWLIGRRCDVSLLGWSTKKPDITLQLPLLLLCTMYHSGS